MPYYSEEDASLLYFDKGDRIRPIHPVYAIPLESQQAIRAYFEENGDFLH